MEVKLQDPNAAENASDNVNREREPETNASAQQTLTSAEEPFMNG